MLATLLLALALASEGSADLSAQANAAYQAKDWAGAAAAYESIVKSNSEDGQAWFRLGVARQSLGKFGQAIEAYQRAEKLGFAPPFTSYNLAAAYARSGDLTRAFEWLDTTLSRGFTDDNALRGDEDFAAVVKDARFPALAARMQKAAHPCHEGPYRQFDFWVGEWDVHTAQGFKVGTSSVQLILDRCVVFENWTDTRGGAGKSFNIYNGATRKWHQTWVSDKGWLTEFAGNFADGAMRFETHSANPAGQAAHRRLSFTLLPDGRVRQFSERTTDGGESWAVDYDFYYTRKSGSPTSP
jgi:tetratricopeptide (TPR) repeat protein